MPTTTELTEKYIREHPSIKDCLKKGLINYSKLARAIAKELGIEKKTSMEAILIAARRFAEKLKKEAVLEDKIMGLLKKSELEIKTKVIVVILDKLIYPDRLIDLEKAIKKDKGLFYSIEGTTAITVLTQEKYLQDIKKAFKGSILDVHQNLAMIVIRSPKEIEITPGVTAYLYSLFGEHGVNIVETMSCWTDVIFVIDEKDVAMAMQFLKF